ncbi:MAG: tetratricopeptide repeat protein [Deltaproteobacteria bacterium]|nr:tetratricopeptide repeat protein [Deltaproteobacteria bacterium]
MRSSACVISRILIGLLVLALAHTAFAMSTAQKFYVEAQNSNFLFEKLALYSQAISTQPDFLEARKERATILYYQKKYELAEHDLNRCIEIDKNSDELYLLRGKVRLAQGNYQGAEQDFTSALKINPENRQAQLERARARYLLGDFDASLTDVRVLLKSGVPDDLTAQAYRIAGFILLHRGDKKLARQYFQMGKMPTDFVFGGFYGWLYEPKRISLIGMVGLIAGVLALFFRFELPAPRKRKK